MSEEETTPVEIPASPMGENESSEQWLARTLREAFVRGHGLTVNCNVVISPEHVKRMVAPVVDDSMFFAAITTADMTRSSVLNLLFNTLVCLHPGKFPSQGGEAQQDAAGEPAGASEAAADSPSGTVVPLETLN